MGRGWVEFLKGIPLIINIYVLFWARREGGLVFAQCLLKVLIKLENEYKQSDKQNPSNIFFVSTKKVSYKSDNTGFLYKVNTE
jgi:hypothetical protein